MALTPKKILRKYDPQIKIFLPPSAGFWCGNVEFSREKFTGVETSNFSRKPFPGVGTLNFSRKQIPGVETLNFSRKTFPSVRTLIVSRKTFPVVGTLNFSRKSFPGVKTLNFSRKTFPGVGTLKFSRSSLTCFMLTFTRLRRDLEFQIFHLWVSEIPYGAFMAETWFAP